MILLYLTLISFISVLEAMSCPGITFSINMEELKKNYIPVYLEANKSMPIKYDDISSKIFPFPPINFRITNIAASYILNTAFKGAQVIDDNFTIVLKNADNFLTIKLEANYSWEIFEWSLLKGKTFVTFEVTNSSLFQTFTQNRGIETKLSTDKMKVDVKISGNDIFDIARSNIKELMNEEYFKKEPLSNFTKEVNKHTAFLYNWFIIEPFNIKDLPLIIYNDLFSINSYENNTDFCFKTKIGVIDRPYSKTVFKFEEVMKFNEAGRVCITHSTLLAISEVMSKAREYYFTIEPKDLGLDKQVMDLLPIVPKVQELFNMTEEMKIGCRANSEMAITLVNTTEGMHLQIPFTCSFDGNHTGYSILTLNVITRTTYNISGDFNDGINFELIDPELYSFNYQGIIGPVSDFMLLQSIALKIVGLLRGQTLLKESLKLSMDLHGSHTKNVTFKNRQTCFTYL